MRSDKFIAKDTTIACEKAGERAGIQKGEKEYICIQGVYAIWYIVCMADSEISAHMS